MSRAEFADTKQSLKSSDAIYERMVIIVPYKSSDKVKAIENAFQNINLDGLNLPNARYLNTFELTEEQKVDRNLDFLGGFELIDSEMRMYVIEGLGGEEKAMNQFYLMNERQHTNDKRFKMIYNPDVKFKNRMYQDFNCAIKKIKLRDTLSQTMSVPDIYLRSKVPIDMYDTLQKFAEIRKLDRASLVRDFNLYPSVENLLALERKYGDSLSLFDLTGQKPKKQRKPRTGGTDGNLTTQDARSELMSFETKTQTQTIDTITQEDRTTTARSTTAPARKVPIEESSEEEDKVQRDVTKRKASTEHQNSAFARALNARLTSQSMDFTR